MIQLVTFVFEIVGTVAFAISGATVAIEKKMDILGVAMLGLVTAIGGGVIRDVIIGNTPVTAFANPVYSIIAVVTALITFVPAIRRKAGGYSKHLEIVLLTMDTVGLGIFTVTGISTTYQVVDNPGIFLLIFVGTMTGVGGGMLRDVLASNTPYIFVKHFYACGSLIGAAVCAIIIPYVGMTIAMVIGAIIVIILRALAIRFKWELPRA